ncbi:MipA/OmpV family protein [Serratia sp. root2]|uniref:MipA/OmpV family protein n=1 Tax=Serratia sp. root2 TaxID=3059676 RepID=UPI00288FD9F3|nr:MipA/OmpV family protein [Serratia sp. root2]MDT3252500.1 MipA/OmpV family protein [Serratia sp. root2]
MKPLSVSSLSFFLRKTSYINIFLIFASLIYPTVSSAASWSLGAAAMLNDYGYVDTDAKTQGLPTVNYEKGNFYIHSLAAGYYLLNTPKDRISVITYYSPLGFDPDDSNNRQMKSLDKRDGTLMAGMAFTHKEKWGVIRASLAGDTLDNSNGVVGDVAFLYPIKVGKLRLVPGIGAVYNNGNQNDYYYGIGHAEAKRSGFSTYSAGESWSPYVELSANYQFNEHWYALASVRVVQLSSEITDSPMVDKDISSQVLLGGGYRF